MTHKKDDLIIFTHIPKTLGSSFMRGVVRPNMPHEKFYYYQTLGKFISDDKDYAFLHGHLPYGLHFFCGRKVKYLTFLRNPIDRAISYYFFVQQGIGNKDTKHPLGEYAKSVGIKKFYQDTRFHNQQTRFTAGFLSHKLYCLMQKKGMRDRILNLAKRNLIKKYYAFGIFERRSDSIKLICRKMNWDEVREMPHYKKTDKRPKAHDLDVETLNALKESHDLDLKLYDFAMREFEKQ